MGTAEMVGSMGLTFFCNKCVELFYKFRQDGNPSEELKKTCQQAISAFNSLKWPNGGQVASEDRISLFNTNEEIRSFERVLQSSSEGVDDAALDKWIKRLKDMMEERIPTEEKKKIAHQLQKFFDALGDYSFLATKECLRGSETIVGV
jgi:hypothetical protein